MVDEITLESSWSAKPRSIERLKTLSSLAIAAGSGATLDEMLQLAAEGVASAVGGHYGLVSIISSDGSSLESSAHWRSGDVSSLDVSREHDFLTSIRRLVDRRRPTYLSLRQIGATEAMLAEKCGIKGCLLAPIVIDDRPVGLVCALFRDPLFEPAEGEVFAGVVAAHCALAFQKDRLAAERKNMDAYKEEFLSAVAHSLKSPLTALKGHAQLLLRKMARGQDCSRDIGSLEAIESQTGRIVKVVNKFLDVGRIEMGCFNLALEPVELVHLVKVAMEQVGVEAYKHELVIESGNDQVIGNWDRKSLERVIASLLDNAVRYSPQGGRIHVRIACHDGVATFSVQDNGLGVPAEEQSHLFEKFFRSNETAVQRIGGLGLSLYLAKRIVQAHGGRIWAESEPDIGSTFSFSLPLE